MYYKQTCPSCQKTLKFPPEGLGRKVRCPYCKTSVTLQMPTDETGAAKPPSQPSVPPPPQASQQPGPASAPPAPKSEQPAPTVDLTSSSPNVSMPLSCIVAAIISVVFYVILVLPLSGFYFGELFLYRGWVPFALVFLLAWSAAILVLKWFKLKRQRESMLLDLLPNEIGETINEQNLNSFVLHVRSQPAKPSESMLVNRVMRGLEHFRVRKNSTEVGTVLSSQSDIDANAVASSYSLVKVFLWAIPILGFIGTVIGISEAVGSFSGALGKAQDMAALKTSLNSVTGGLATAFDTTLVALVMSIFVMFPISSLRKSEDDLLNWVDEYCNENLIRRLDDVSSGKQKTTEDYPEQVKAAIKDAMAVHLAEIQSWSAKLETITQNLTNRLSEAWASIYQEQTKEFSSMAELLTSQAAKLEERAVQHQNNVEASLKRMSDQVRESMSALSARSQTAQQEFAATMERTAQSLETPIAAAAQQMNSTVGNFSNSAAATQQQMAQALEQVSDSVKSAVSQLNQKHEEFVSSLVNQTQQTQQQAASVMSDASESVNDRFGLLEQGLSSLNDVLTKLGEHQIIIQQQPRRGWFGIFGRRNGGK